ncbi:MAG: PaaI family thioesterase [Thermoplasmatota archaeon]
MSQAGDHVPAPTSGRGRGVQFRFAPNSICFGCGPANSKGLRIESDWDGDEFVCRFQPEPHHQAFPGVLNGGICGTLLDCHSNWCAATTIMRERKLDAPPTTVTAEFNVKLRRPTPADRVLLVKAKPVSIEGDRVAVDAEILADGKVTASCKGLFVAVQPGHPAYHRWA